MSEYIFNELNKWSAREWIGDYGSYFIIIDRFIPEDRCSSFASATTEELSDRRLLFIIFVKTVAMLILNNPISRDDLKANVANTFGVLIILLFVSLSACSVTKKVQSLSEQLESNHFTEEMISVESAKRVLEEGNAELLLIGGISPTVVIDQREFKRKYGVDYYDFGDLPIFSDEEIAKWNRVIFEWLNEHYGTKWQKDVRQDVIGYKEWVQQSPASK